MSLANKNTVHVAVGVIQNAQHHVLVAQRQVGQHLAGVWEFPGGKVDENETPEQALVRELKEELGITAHDYRFLFDIDHDYAEKSVQLHIFLVSAFDGQAQGKEGQPLQWLSPKALLGMELPAANAPILDYLLGADGR